MFNTPRNRIVAASICALLFAFGLVKLFWLRFESGDLYPAYSSLRSDPLGAQVLYESLDRLQANPIARNYRPFNHLTVNADQTLLLLGLAGSANAMKHPHWKHLLEQVARDGGRLVVTIRGSVRGKTPDDAPVDCPDRTDEPIQAEDDGTDGDAKTPGKAAEKKDQDQAPIEEKPGRDEDSPIWPGVWKTLGIEVLPSDAKSFDDMAVRSETAPVSLPAGIPYRSPFFFRLNDTQWQTIYRWNGEPVVISRAWGRGRVVMAADSYLFSNEALRLDRFPELLTWFIEPAHGIIVDEYHHGLVRRLGIADLMRRYRLHGLVFSLMVPLILWLWRRSAPFVIQPVEQDLSGHDAEAGHDTSEGLVNLMQQHIRAGDLLQTCYQAWRGSAAGGKIDDDRIRRIERIVAGVGGGRSGDPVGAYQQICDLLKEGKLS